MKFLFIHVYYPQFLKSFYQQKHGSVDSLSYKEHQRELLAELFGDADFYSDGIKKQGHEAEDIIANDEFLQKKWTIEQGYTSRSIIDTFAQLKYVKRFLKASWIEKILHYQIQLYNPEIIYFHDIEFFSIPFLQKLRKEGKLIVAQKASIIARLENFKQAYIVFTSFPHFVNLFKDNGVNAKYLKLAFADKILKVIPRQEKKFNCSFIGGLSKSHNQGTTLLTKVAEEVDIDFFGYGKEILIPNTKIYQKHHGEVWGKEMYMTMMQSRMTINRHIDVAENYANNMRLYEATGSGALLITDSKSNLAELFEIDKEIIAYQDVSDLVKKIKYYTEHQAEAALIAQAGQKRTLQDHTYSQRMAEVIEHIKNFNRV